MKPSGLTITFSGGYHVDLRQSVFVWRAEFYRGAMPHSRSTWVGVGTVMLPWRAVLMDRPTGPALTVRWIEEEGL